MTNLWESYQSRGWEKFVSYRVRLHLHDIVGGLPLAPDILKVWVETMNREKTQEERTKITQAHLEELEGVTEEMAEKKGTGFARVDGQLVIEGRQVKAMLKEAANIIKKALPKAVGKEGKIAALKSKVAETLFVEERYILLGRTEPDEVVVRPISVMGARGPRTSIKVSEVCHDVELEFTLKRLAKGSEVTEAVMLHILDYAQDTGLGADRSQGRGRFQVVSVEKV